MRKLFCTIFITIIAFHAGFPQSDADSGLLNPVLLENFFDGLMNDHLKSKHAAGAVVAVVKDGKLVFSKGYGYSDYATKQPVSPDSTLFRIGSISKTFVWTAVMQLVEQGKLDLDTDINIYLKDFKIPEGKGGPITLRHLMTHTPGFEDRLIGLFAKDEKALRPFGEILKEQLPERVRPAGEEMSYSNHGTGIAAYIVEQVSGLSWDDYVESKIIKPLNMNLTTFRQPLPEPLSGMVSKGYNYENGALKEYPFELIPLSAVGGASTTASDMARYMITHLQMGRFDNLTILDSVSASRMQSVEFRVSPYVSGIGLGIYELVNWNGIRTIGHGGDTFWFHSLMALIPEKRTGLFVSFNSQGGDYSQVFGLFMNHFYPINPPQPALKITKDDADRFTGDFRFNRFPHSDLTRLTSIMNTVKISFDTSGYLVTRSGDTQKWYMVNDSVFIKETGDEYLVFGKKKKDRYTKAYLGNLAVMPLERVPLLDSASLNIPVMIIYMIIFIITLVLWPAVYLIRKKYTLNSGEPGTLPALNKWTGWLSSLMVIVFFTGITSGLSTPWEIIYGVPAIVRTVLVIPLILCVFLVAIIYLASRLKSGNKYNLSGKLHFYALALALILLLWQLNHWNLLGFKY